MTTETPPPPPESLAPVPEPSRAKRYGLAAVIVAALVSAALSVLGSVVALRALGPASSSSARVSDAAVYHCPMHPTIVQDHPGDCPICGMKLVKVEKGTSGAPAQPSQPMAGSAPVAGLGTVDIDSVQQQLIGLKTAEVSEGLVGGAWRTVGRVAIDETRVRHVNLKVPGFVERIYVDYVGKKVKKGDPLFSIYSPELLAAQEEYLLALRTQSALDEVGRPEGGGASDMVAASRRKLELWDVSSAAMDKIAETSQPTRTLTLYSPVAGVVTKKDVVEGMKLDAGAMPYEIVDLSQVWVLADVYESELRFVKEGMAAQLMLTAFPNREFTGKVVFLDPLLDPLTRTVKLRLTFPNPTGELRPEMFGDVVLHGLPRTALRVPRDAVIDSGTQKVVFVAIGEGKFEPRAVEVGQSGEAHVEITRGLRAGERVVVRANFLVDSESRLRASLAATTEPPAREKAPESARVLRAPSAPSASAPSHAGHRP